MQNGRWSPDRISLAALRDRGTLGKVTAGLFYGARTHTLMAGVTLDCGDNLRVTKVTVTHAGVVPINVRIVGVDANGIEDAARTYEAVCLPGTTNIPVSTVTGQHIQLQPTRVGGWGGFSTYTW